MFTKNNYTNVGQTELRVSPITLGTMTFGDQNTQSDAFEQLDYAASKGINSIDVAEMYPVPPKQIHAIELKRSLGIGLKVKKEKILLSQRRLQALGDLLIG